MRKVNEMREHGLVETRMQSEKPVCTVCQIHLGEVESMPLDVFPVRSELSTAPSVPPEEVQLPWLNFQTVLCFRVKCPEASGKHSSHSFPRCCRQKVIVWQHTDGRNVRGVEIVLSKTNDQTCFAHPAVSDEKQFVKKIILFRHGWSCSSKGEILHRLLAFFQISFLVNDT